MSQALRLHSEPLEPRRLLAAEGALVCSVDDVYEAIRRQDHDVDVNMDGQLDLADARYLVEEVFASRMGDLNLDRRVDFTDFLSLAAHFGNTDANYAQGDLTGDARVGFADFLQFATHFGFESPGRAISLQDGAVRIPNRFIFDQLAHRADVPGAAGIPEVKFMLEVETGQVTFLNHNTHSLHYLFARDVLGFSGSPWDFNTVTYFTDARTYLAGSVLAHDHFEGGSEQGIFTIEFWPTDPVKASHVSDAVKRLQTAMPFARHRLFYHPAGETQSALHQREQALYVHHEIPVISTEELFGNQSFAALNPGVAFGRLRVVDGEDAVPLTLRDLVIFEQIPNDLTHVAGVITVQPQTPLSHVNLRAKQNDTPNAYIRDALTDPVFQGLLGKLVRFEVVGDRYTIREATAAEVEEHFETIRPQGIQFAARDLNQRSIVPLASLRTADQTAYGAKSANLGELAQILSAEMVPDGFALPFSLYDEFMRRNGFYDTALEMMATAGFYSDAKLREGLLDDFRKTIRDGEVGSAIGSALDAVLGALRTQFGEGTSFRARSSTNNEDLLGFTGAGLYRSYTHHPHEGRLEKTIKQVWSSLWTFRAFEEREFWRIDHLSAAMGVAIHPNFEVEQVNGVAVTKNIYDPFWRGFYVNAQVGEDLVTNPEGGAIPEEFLISAIGPQLEWEVQYIRYSNLTEDGGHVLSAAHIDQLRVAMETIQSHFQEVYGAQGDPNFAMDIEFKVDAAGQLVVKQARPWVD